MFRGRRFALMLMRRWTAPMRHVCRRETVQSHRRGQSCPGVQSVAAWSEPLTSSEEDKPEEDASCCDPDKGLGERQTRIRCGWIVVAYLDAWAQTRWH